MNHSYHPWPLRNNSGFLGSRDPACCASLFHEDSFIRHHQKSTLKYCTQRREPIWIYLYVIYNQIWKNVETISRPNESNIFISQQSEVWHCSLFTLKELFIPRKLLILTSELSSTWKSETHQTWGMPGMSPSSGSRLKVHSHWHLHLNWAILKHNPPQQSFSPMASMAAVTLLQYEPDTMHMHDPATSIWS